MRSWSCGIVSPLVDGMMIALASAWRCGKCLFRTSMLAGDGWSNLAVP